MMKRENRIVLQMALACFLIDLDYLYPLPYPTLLVLPANNMNESREGRSEQCFCWFRLNASDNTNEKTSTRVKQMAVKCALILYPLCNLTEKCQIPLINTQANTPANWRKKTLPSFKNKRFVVKVLCPWL